MCATYPLFICAKNPLFIYTIVYIYMCDNMDIGTLRRVIFEFIAAIAF